MGAHNLGTTIPWCTTRELGAAFLQLKDNDRSEFGTDPYSGSWNTIDRVVAHEAKVFTDQGQADDYCREHARKWDFAVAVPLVTLAFTKEAEAKVAKAQGKVKGFQIEKLYPLEGRVMKACGWKQDASGKMVENAWYPTDALWEQEMRKQILARVKAGASKFKKCGKCGSNLNVALLVSVVCPIPGCNSPFMITPTDEKAFELRKGKIAKAKAELAVLEAEVKKVEEEAKKTAKEASRCWYVAGWAAS